MQFVDWIAALTTTTVYISTDRQHAPVLTFPAEQTNNNAVRQRRHNGSATIISSPRDPPPPPCIHACVQTRCIPCYACKPHTTKIKPFKDIIGRQDFPYNTLHVALLCAVHLSHAPATARILYIRRRHLHYPPPPPAPSPCTHIDHTYMHAALCYCIRSYTPKAKRVHTELASTANKPRFTTMRGKTPSADRPGEQLRQYRVPSPPTAPINHRYTYTRSETLFTAVVSYYHSHHAT